MASLLCHAMPCQLWFAPQATWRLLRQKPPLADLRREQQAGVDVWPMPSSTAARCCTVPLHLEHASAASSSSFHSLSCSDCPLAFTRPSSPWSSACLGMLPAAYASLLDRLNFVQACSETFKEFPKAVEVPFIVVRSGPQWHPGGV